MIFETGFRMRPSRSVDISIVADAISTTFLTDFPRLIYIQVV
jgi:hypothetical protein